MTEKLSSLLDGELSGSEFDKTWRSVVRDAGLLDTAGRYQMIGALMRKECSDAAVQVLRSKVADSIARQIDQEPQWLMPAAGRGAKPSGYRVSKRPAFLGGFAAAAAIAALAVFVVSPNWPGNPLQQEAPIAATNPEGGGSGVQMSDENLNALLVEHGEFSSSAGLNGLIAYAKFVSYDGNR